MRISMCVVTISRGYVMVVVVVIFLNVDTPNSTLAPACPPDSDNQA